MDYRDLEVSTNPEVYPPSEDSFLSAEMVSDYLSETKGRNLDVLDMGTGSGILGLTASLSDHVKTVTFLDISEKALALAKKNFEANKEKINSAATFTKSDLFSEIPKGRLFDLIIFNAPYLRNEKKDEEKEHNPWSGGNEGIELSVKFLEEAVRHLGKNGKIVLNASSLGNLEKLRREIKTLGFSIARERKTHIFFEDIISLMLAKGRSPPSNGEGASNLFKHSP